MIIRRYKISLRKENDSERRGVGLRESEVWCYRRVCRVNRDVGLSALLHVAYLGTCVIGSSTSIWIV